MSEVSVTVREGEVGADDGSSDRDYPESDEGDERARRYVPIEQTRAEVAIAEAGQRDSISPLLKRM